MRARSSFILTVLLLMTIDSGCSQRDSNKETAERSAVSAKQLNEEPLRLIREFTLSVTKEPLSTNADAMAKAGRLLGKTDKGRGERILDTLAVRYAMASVLLDQGIKPQYDELAGYISPGGALTQPNAIKDQHSKDSYNDALSNYLANQESSKQIVNGISILKENYERENP